MILVNEYQTQRYMCKRLAEILSVDSNTLLAQNRDVLRKALSEHYNDVISNEKLRKELVKHYQD